MLLIRRNDLAQCAGIGSGICIRCGGRQRPVIIAFGIGIGNIQQQLLLILGCSDFHADAATQGVVANGHRDLRQGRGGRQHRAVMGKGLLPHIPILAGGIRAGSQGCRQIGGEHNRTDIVLFHHFHKCIVQLLFVRCVTGSGGCLGQRKNFGERNLHHFRAALAQFLYRRGKGGGDLRIQILLMAAGLGGHRAGQFLQNAEPQSVQRIAVEVFRVVILSVGQHVHHDRLVMDGPGNGTDHIPGAVKLGHTVSGNKVERGAQADTAGISRRQTQGGIGIRT